MKDTLVMSSLTVGEITAGPEKQHRVSNICQCDL